MSISSRCRLLRDRLFGNVQETDADLVSIEFYLDPEAGAVLFLLLKGIAIERYVTTKLVRAAFYQTEPNYYMRTIAEGNIGVTRNGWQCDKS